MSVDSEEVRAESHMEIGSILVRDAGVMLERWSRRAAEEQPQAKRVHHQVLQDHLGLFLKVLGQSLAGSESPHTKRHRETAAEHGEQRWDHGWSLAEVVRDYQILRLVILEYLEEVLDRPLSHREGQAIGLVLDEAISASVVNYVEERDEHFSRMERERSETEQKTQQQLQEHAVALQEADRRKNEFLAMLGHELRNPLASIYTALEIQRLKMNNDPQLQDAREIIDRQVRYLTRLVDDLLDVSRITRGKIKLDRGPVDIATVLRGALETAQPVIASRNHQVTTRISADPIWVEGDPSRLTQVVVNLLNNAAKYTPNGGQIEVSAEQLNGDMVFTVRDTGIGIAPDLLPRVFEPFVQADRSLGRSDGGLGLGLTLVRSLVELHGGTIEAYSEGKDKGSEFVVRLPVMAEAPDSTDQGQAHQDETRCSEQRILVVDDHRDGARTLAMLLRLDGHEVEIVHDGPSALEFVGNWLPKVVLLDIGLPGMDGLEVARRLRNEPRFTDIVLIAITGYGQDDDHQRTQEAGFQAHLVKPVDLAALRKLFAGICP